MIARRVDNVHHLRVGDFVVTTIQDASLQGGFGLISNLDESTMRDLHAASRRPTPPKITLNCYRVDTGEERILIDTGLGGPVGDEGARLGAGLDEMGLAPADIDRVILTHSPPAPSGRVDRRQFSLSACRDFRTSRRAGFVAIERPTGRAASRSGETGSSDRACSGSRPATGRLRADDSRDRALPGGRWSEN